MPYYMHFVFVVVPFVLLGASGRRVPLPKMPAVDV